MATVIPICCGCHREKDFPGLGVDDPGRNSRDGRAMRGIGMMGNDEKKWDGKWKKVGSGAAGASQDLAPAQ